MRLKRWRKIENDGTVLVLVSGVPGLPWKSEFLRAREETSFTDEPQVAT